MNTQIGLGAFGTFGEPFGYQQVFFLNAVFGGSLDLNTNAIEVYPGAELYAVKRETANGFGAVSCCLYTYAKELNSNRGGTFIGSCVVLNNGYLKGETIYTLLRELHTDLISNPKNMVDNTLQVQKAAQLVVTEPVGFTVAQARATAVAPAATAIDAQRKFLVTAPAAGPASENPIAQFFEEAVTYFTDTDTLYFTTDKRIIEYVTEKGLLSIANWEAFQNYKVQKQQQEKEAKRRAEAAKKQEKIQPGKSQVVPIKVPALYEEWKEGKPDKEAFRKMVHNHNLLLKAYLQLKEQPVPHLPTSNNTAYYPQSERSAFRIKKKHLLYTIIVLSVLLLITTAMLFLRSGSPPQEAAVAQTGISVVDSTLPEKTRSSTDSLVPFPNTELPQSEVTKLAKTNIKGKNLHRIVDAVFQQNPLAVATVYSWQKKEYAEWLRRKNEACFTKDSTGYVCRCDTLPHIPAFKK